MCKCSLTSDPERDLLHQKVTILGQEYKVDFVLRSEDKDLEDKDAYCDTFNKHIVVERMTDEYAKAKMAHALHHEVVHAFLFESGLDSQSWAVNEEIVDWIAWKVCDIMNSLISLRLPEV